MVAITEDHVSFETAKLLKEKGFDEPCRCWYYVLGTTPLLVERRYDDYYEQSKYTDKIFPCITLQMAMKFLREEHHIFIQVELYSKYDDYCFELLKYCLENLI